MYQYYIFYHRLIDTSTISKKAHKWLIHTVFRLNVISKNASVGEKIRFYRCKQDMKCPVISEKIDVSESALLDYKNNKTEPGLEVSQRISEVLKLPVTTLWDDYYLFYATLTVRKYKKSGPNMA